MTVHRYVRISAHRTRSGKCPSCGKRRTRSKTFTSTVNPYNRNEDGTIKTPREVRLDLNAKASRWVPDFTCAEHPGGPIHPDDPNLTDHQKEHQP